MLDDSSYGGTYLTIDNGHLNQKKQTYGKGVVSSQTMNHKLNVDAYTSNGGISPTNDTIDSTRKSYASNVLRR